MTLRPCVSTASLGVVAVILIVLFVTDVANSAEPRDSSSDPPTLESQLKERREGFSRRAPEAARNLMKEKAEELANSGIVEKSFGIGDKVTDFELPNARGKEVRLSKLLQDGPVVLTFYRGGWCPYCNLELRAFQRILPEITKNGGRLVAISPELPDKSLSTKEKNELEFEVLSDRGNKLARKFGLVFALAAEIRPIYKQFGIDLAASNGDDSFELPVPATYVIDRDGTIRFAYVNTDYTRRGEPADAVKVLKGLSR